MNRRLKGFTLIELVVVIIVLGVLAAVAIPKYLSVSLQAQAAAARGVAAAISSATQMNFAKRLANPTAGIAVGVVGVCNWNFIQQFMSGAVIISWAPSDTNEYYSGGGVTVPLQR